MGDGAGMRGEEAAAGRGEEGRRRAGRGGEGELGPAWNADGIETQKSPLPTLVNQNSGITFQKQAPPLK